MTEQEWLAERFEEYRPRLRAVAYRLLGSLSEADDAVQDAWLRLNRTDAGQVENLGAWLTTVTARVALNMLRSRRSRREEPLEVHVPDPIVDPAGGTDPEHEALLADSVGPALLVVLDTLSPAERLAFVLHDMFAVPFDEIARIVDVVLRADSGPAGPSREIRGAEAVVGQALMWSRVDLTMHRALVNGAAGIVSTRDGRPFSVGALTIRQGRIAEIDVLGDPERLARLDLTVFES
jgi:RNA polymerase sigma factor (sigma-70 family)